MLFPRLQQGARAAVAAQARAAGQTINQTWGQLTAAEEQIALQHFLWGLQDSLPEEGGPAPDSAPPTHADPSGSSDLDLDLAEREGVVVTTAAQLQQAESDALLGDSSEESEDSPENQYEPQCGTTIFETQATRLQCAFFVSGSISRISVLHFVLSFCGMAESKVFEIADSGEI